MDGWINGLMDGCMDRLGEKQKLSDQGLHLGFSFGYKHSTCI